MKTIEYWEEWREKCALALCGCQTQQVLQEFAHSRFKHYATIYARTANVHDPAVLTPPAWEAWHRFETHFRIGTAPGAKSFKQWLFARLDADGYSSQESVEAGATLLLRDVVRERIRRDFSPSFVVPWDRTTVGTADTAGGRPTPILQELLPSRTDTINDVERRELEDLAEQDSRSAFGELSRRERIALLARELGLSLAHPAVLRIADCGRSTLNTAYHNALASLASHVRSRHPREDAETLATLSCLVYRNVKGEVLSWGKSENGCPQLCTVVER